MKSYRHDGGYLKKVMQESLQLNCRHQCIANDHFVKFPNILEIEACMPFNASRKPPMS